MDQEWDMLRLFACWPKFWIFILKFVVISGNEEKMDDDAMVVEYLDEDYLDAFEWGAMEETEAP